MENLFLNPEIDFEFISDSILWDKIFLNPWPVDINEPSGTTVTLSKFFEVNNASVDSGRGYFIKRKLLLTREGFYNQNSERDLAFVVLCKFLIRYNRPFRDCYIRVPNHPKIKESNEYLPADIYYKTPRFPLLNETKDRLRLNLCPDYFKEVYKYCFGYDCDSKTIKEPCHLDFSFKCFRGFLLHY